MSRRKSFNGSASGRRRERRAALQSELTKSTETLHRPTLNRAQKQAQGKHSTPSSIGAATPIKLVAQAARSQQDEYKRHLERAAIVFGHEFGHAQMESGMCLPDVAIYAAGYRKTKQITAR